MFDKKEIEGKNYKCFFLDWDTEYFGVNSARVNLTGPIAKEDQDKIIDFCKKYDFITIANVNNIEENNYWIGTKTNAFLTDINIQFVKKIQNKSLPKDENTYVINNVSNNKRILEISKNTFEYSRFFNDPILPGKQAKNIYYQWAESAFQQDNKYFVVNERAGQITGYILFSINENSSTIELIAVDKNNSGMGVGKSLMRMMECFLIDNKINKIKVGTQVNNVNAINFYSNIGFTYKNDSSIYHLWEK